MSGRAIARDRRQIAPKFYSSVVSDMMNTLSLLGCALAGSLAEQVFGGRRLPAQAYPEVGFMMVAAALTLLSGYYAGYGETSMTFYMASCFVVIMALLRFGAWRVDEYLWGGLGVNAYGIRKLWELTWVACVTTFWVQTANGTLPRVGPDEPGRMIGCACFWVLAMLMPHVLTLHGWQRLILNGHALAVLFTSPHWGGQLLLAMGVGKVIGYAVQHMRQEKEHMRQLVEQLRQEKEFAFSQLSDPALLSTLQQLERSVHESPATDITEPPTGTTHCETATMCRDQTRRSGA